ncbi:MAG: hypothetical protein ACLU9S_08685 [Oscillospiraceae bacterium]
MELAQGVRLAKVTAAGMIHRPWLLGPWWAVRIDSAIPEKIAVVGIEVPNKQVTHWGSLAGGRSPLPQFCKGQSKSSASPRAKTLAVPVSSAHFQHAHCAHRRYHRLR